MKYYKLNVILVFLLLIGSSLDVFAQEEKVDTRIDNMSYWKSMAKKGLVPVAPDVPPPAAKPVSSMLIAPGVIPANSVDVPVTNTQSTQSENSIFVNPNGRARVLNSNNSTADPFPPLYGTSYFLSNDSGVTWTGSEQGAGGTNSGDPAAVISNSGRHFIGYIAPGFNQGVSYSDDNGVTWTPVVVSASSGLLDKNHLWIDNSLASPYEGNLYDAWTSFGGSNPNDIELSRSTDAGVTWSPVINISSAISAGSHNQGVNLQTGPNGEVYAVWAIYDSWPADENAIGFAKSTDGGVTFGPAQRIISNIRGIRISGTNKNMRVNSFPTMTVDVSGGPNDGDIYVVWSNIGEPGINTGSDIDVYMIKSQDQGNTWSVPQKVNQDPAGLGKEHYFPWITSDPVNGNLHVIFYDNRNVGNVETEVFVANSFDGGSTWSDFRVSDVSFTPAPIPGLAGGYFGDYLGISARDGIVYPVWTDNRANAAMAYCSPFVVGCVQDLVLQNQVVAIGSSVLEEANNSITLAGGGTTYLVDGDGVNGGKGVYIAGNSIRFQTGFTARKGSVVRAFLQACTTSPVAPLALSEANLKESTQAGTAAPDAGLQTGPLEFAVYPNPGQGNFQMSFRNVSEDQRQFAVSVHSLMGKLVYFEPLMTPEGTINFDLSDQTEGIYLLRIMRQDEVIETRKLLIRR
ncbi:MAG: T9SS type A sorting domain-containing protein [Bacteroidota bacterium]